MTLRELEQTLPDGFHDAEFRSVLIDYARHRVVIEGTFCVGDPDGKVAPTEARRDAELVIDGLQFVAIEPPDPQYKFAVRDYLWVDLVEGPKVPKVPAASNLPPGCFVSAFFVSDWNAFLQVAGESASLAWKGEMFVPSDL